MIAILCNNDKQFKLTLSKCGVYIYRENTSKYRRVMLPEDALGREFTSYIKACGFQDKADEDGISLEDLVKSRIRPEAREKIEFGGRATGKTTRLIDHAIQELFKYGELEIPTQAQIDSYKREPKGLRRIYIIDCDSASNNLAQMQFTLRLRDRIRNEHADTVTELAMNRWKVKKQTLY